MKNWVKIFVALGFLPMIFACATNDKQEEKFVNPIFYKTMEPYSAGTGCAKLTPTNIYWSLFMRRDCDKWLNEDINNEEKTITYDCQLIKNTEKELAYLCGNDIEIFTIKNKEEISFAKVMIRHKSCDKDYPNICGGASYIVK